jgi:transcriptional regulator with XRE-family HTH domain
MEMTINYNFKLKNMNSEVDDNPVHIGRNIERIRRLRGFTQDDVSKGLNISKQAVSQIEQSEKIDEERLKQIADVLGVTLEGLKGFREQGIFYHTNNFYEAATFTNSVAHAHSNVFQNPLEKIIELYENLLKVEREKVEILQKINNR